MKFFVENSVYLFSDLDRIFIFLSIKFVLVVVVIFIWCCEYLEDKIVGKLYCDIYRGILLKVKVFIEFLILVKVFGIMF